MPSLLIGGAISAGTSLLGGLLGNNAASKAAQQQAAAGGRAAGLEAAAGQQAQGYQTGQLASEKANEQPFVGAGQGTVNSLASMLQPGGQLTQQFGQFQAPTGVTEQNDPGYQFRLQQGENALQSSAAARGGLLSTGTAKNLTDYAQGAASQEYGNVYNRALQTYGTNFNAFNTGQNNLYNRLFGVSQLGQGAASSLNNVQQAGTNNLSNILLGSAQAQGNDILGIGQAQAAGTVGGSNALRSGLTGAGNDIAQMFTLKNQLGGANAGGSGGGGGASNDGWTGM
jgi:hypothetical protein